MARTNFNTSPFFDDFSEDKNFYRILFRPSRAIQTRELNQIQSILGNQTEQFANHIFKFGSMVKSGSVRFKNYTPYVRLKDLTPSGKSIDISRFDGKRVKGVSSGLLAEVILSSAKDSFDPATLFVSYINTAVDGTTSAFVNGETLQVLDDKGFVIYEAVVRCPTCATAPDNDTVNPTGFGALFAVEPSSYYVHGYIVPIDLQMIILDKYKAESTYKVGFDIVQSIVTADDDTSLLDNALGTPNFTAPGGDRYKIALSLTKKPLTDTDDENFVLIAKIQNGNLQEVKDKPQYSEIMDTLARRTHDESGDYTVTPFKINFREHAAENNNNGWVPIAEGGNTKKYVVEITPGKCYVRGREIDVIADRIVEVDKARNTDKKRSSVVRPLFGNYITMTFDVSSNTLPTTDTTATNDFVVDFEKVKFYNGAVSGGVPTGTNIGDARVKGIELHSGTAGSVGAVYKLYLFEINLNPGSTIQNVKGIHRTGGGSQVFAGNIKPDPGGTGTINKIYKPDNNNLLYTVPFEYLKSVRDADNPLVSNTSVTVLKKLVGAVNAQLKVIFSSEGDETFLNFDQSKWIGGLQATSGANFSPYDITTTNKIIVTPSEITIQNFTQADAGKNFVLVCEVLKSNAKEKTKVLNTNFLSGVAGNVSTINLQKADAFRLVSVIDVTVPATPVNVTSNYILNNGVKDNYYSLSSLNLKPGLPVPAAATLLNIEYEYFQHTGSGYYFSVDSYTSAINDPSFDFDYEDIPTHTSNAGVEYRLTDTFDFRPTIGSDGTFSHASANLSNMPVDESNIIFDVEYYLPRIDLLCVTENGDFVPVKGNPDLEPDVPHAAENSMAIYEIHMDAYTFNVGKNVKMKYLDNKRYTMRDIGKLESRIGNLEYYVTFNLLEKDTADTEILDANGNNRFKNGFLVDNFKDFIASDTGSPEYNAALDTDEGELRPSFISRSVKAVLNATESSHFKKTSNVVTFPYTNKVWMEQPFATKTVSVNPYFIWNQEGTIVLSPNMDTWKDTTQAPNVNVSVDTGFDAISQIANRAGVLGTQWGSWRTTDSSTRVASRTTGTTTTGTTTTTTSTTTSSQVRTGINTNITRNIQRRNLGTAVTSVNLLPFMRSIPVQFVATGLKPNTRVYAFFDDTDVNKECRPLNGSNGDPLVSDSSGNVIGTFTIPSRPDKRFFTGQRLFRLTNTKTNSFSADELTTSAQTEFNSNGLAETRRQTVLSVTRPRLINRTTSASRNVTSANRTITNTAPVPNVRPQGPSFTPAGTREWRWAGEGGDGGGDPLAQSFVVADKTGVFLTGIDLYFSAKDGVVPVWLQVRNMVNGYPGPVVVPYSDCRLQPTSINVTDDASVATRFTFQAPVYLQPDEEYCFVVGADVETPRIHVSRLGGTTVGSNPVTVSTQPHLGSMFKSQNDKTWNAEQYEDIKFRLHRAAFDFSTDMNLVFNNSDYELAERLDDNPFETQTTSRLVRVYMNNHGLVANDKVKLHVLSETEQTIHLTSGNLVVGQQLVGAVNAGTAIIKELVHTGVDSASNDVYKVKLAEMKGIFAPGESFTGPVYYENFGDQDVLNSLNIVPKTLVHNVPVGKFPVGINATFNGIPLTNLSTPEHLVQNVDSMDSFIIQVDTPATANGRTGGSGCRAIGNIQVDSFEFQLNYVDFTGESQWNVSGVKHGAIGSNVVNYSAQTAVPFIPNATKLLVHPLKIANKTNEGMNLAGKPSIKLTGVLNGYNDYVSPVVNLDSLSFTTVSNRIEWNTCQTYSVAPLATTNGLALDCDPNSTGYNARWNIETSYGGGSEGAKYIMKPVTLSNPATNIKVYMDILNFLDTEVQIYYRTLPAESDAEIKTITWVKAELDDSVVSESDVDFREAEVTIPSGPTGSLPEFKSFQVKLILRTKNTARPPKVRKFRAIAVT